MGIIKFGPTSTLPHVGPYFGIAHGVWSLVEQLPIHRTERVTLRLPCLGPLPHI
jgi:hypothetical protein